MKNVVIIGNGPAGISAALYTKRGNIETTVIGRDLGALKKADKIENYYGFAQPISGTDLVNAGIESAKRIGCEVISDEVVSLAFEDKLVVKTKTTDYKADAVILTTGTSRNAPKIEGLTKFEGKGVSYCAVCDAFFYRGKNVCVLGSGDYALHEALELVPIANTVTILTNGEPLTVSIPDSVKLDERKITSFSGGETLSSVTFEEGNDLLISGAFIAIGIFNHMKTSKYVKFPYKYTFR